MNKPEVLFVNKYIEGENLYLGTIVNHPNIDDTKYISKDKYNRDLEEALKAQREACAEAAWNLLDPVNYPKFSQDFKQAILCRHYKGKTMIDKTIRMQVMRGNGQKIRDLLLNQDQIELVKMIKESGTFRASLLSVLTGVSIQNASTKLNKLYLKGYIDRIARSAESGGIEYIYVAK